MPFIPYSDRVVLRVHDEASSNMNGGLVMPDSAKEKPQEATVVAVGPGYLNDAGYYSPLQCNAGQHVFFTKYAGTKIFVEGEELLIVHESEILGHLTTEPAPPPSAPTADDDDMPF